MKKKSLLFFIYCAVMITIIIVMLVFAVQKSYCLEVTIIKDNIDTSTNSQDNPNDEENEDVEIKENIQNKENEESIDNNDNEKNEELKIVGGKVLTLSLGNSLKLMNGYFNKNINLLESNVSIENDDVVKYDNKVFVATAVGSTSVEICINNQTLSFTISVISVETDARCYLKRNSIIVGETINISDMLFIDNSINDYSVDYGELVVNSNLVTANAKGSYNISVSYEKNYVKYCYNFKITAIENASKKIVTEFDEYEFNLNDNAIVTIFVQNGNEEMVYQNICFDIENESILDVNLFVAPKLYLNLKSEGRTSITLRLKDDLEMTKTIFINVKK